MINPLLVEGQIHGGVAHGIGNAFYEQLVYDEQGQLLNASFMDYLLPTATDVPPIETAHRETPSPFNPIGLKGVGEAGCIPTGAVFAQAVEDALGRRASRSADSTQPQHAVRARPSHRMKPAPFCTIARGRWTKRWRCWPCTTRRRVKPLAGGQSLIPAMNFRLATPAVLVDPTGERARFHRA